MGPLLIGRLRAAYVGALALIGLVVVANQATILMFLDADLRLAEIVNVAGRQRMRSQRIAKSVERLAGTDRPEQFQRASREVWATAQALLEDHARLREGDLSTVPSSLHPARSQLAGLDPFVEALAREAERARDSSYAARHEAEVIATRLADIEARFLPRMDRIVTELAAVPAARLPSLVLLQVASCTLVLLFLALLARVVFYPVERSLSSAAEARQAMLKRLEASLEASMQEVERARTLQSVGHLASRVAHDLNNYLQVIGLHADLITEGDDPRSAARSIQGAASDAAHLSRQLLDLNRTGPEPRKTVAKVATLLLDLEPLLRSLLPKSTTLLVRAHSERWIVCDPPALRQLLINLTMNALHAMPEGGALAFELRDVRDGVEIGVEDTGTGIPADILDHIFEPFVTTKGPGEGHGLG
ncbi:MAG: ATP-binding protein, partial [Myxococcota bacterium]